MTDEPQSVFEIRWFVGPVGPLVRPWSVGPDQDQTRPMNFCGPEPDRTNEFLRTKVDQQTVGPGKFLGQIQKFFVSCQLTFNIFHYFWSDYWKTDYRKNRKLKRPKK